MRLLSNNLPSKAVHDHLKSDLNELVHGLPESRRLAVRHVEVDRILLDLWLRQWYQLTQVTKSS